MSFSPGWSAPAATGRCGCGTRRAVHRGDPDRSHRPCVRRWRWPPDGARLVSAGRATGRCGCGTRRPVHRPRPLTGHTGWVRAVAVVAGRRPGWSAPAHDGTVRVWDAATGAPQATLTGHTGWVRAVAWSPDGGPAGRLRRRRRDGAGVGRGDRRTARRTLTGHTGWVRAVAWSPDGARLVGAGGDRTVRVWDAATGAPPATLTGHTGWVRAVAWSPDGTRLAGTGGDRRTVRVWDAASGAPQATLTGRRHRPGAGGGVVTGWDPAGQRRRRQAGAGVGRGERCTAGDPDRSHRLGAGGGVVTGWDPAGQRERRSDQHRDAARGEVQAQLRLGQLTDVAWGTAVAVAGPDGVVVLDLRSPHGTSQRLM